MAGVACRRSFSAAGVVNPLYALAHLRRAIQLSRCSGRKRGLKTPACILAHLRRAAQLETEENARLHYCYLSGTPILPVHLRRAAQLETVESARLHYCYLSGTPILPMHLLCAFFGLNGVSIGQRAEGPREYRRGREPPLSICGAQEIVSSAEGATDFIGGVSPRDEVVKMCGGDFACLGCPSLPILSRIY